jgi:hypothetical protein
MEVTPIRPSQFMTRNGPGALTPTVEGSILMPQLSALVQELLRSGTKASISFSKPNSVGKTGLYKFEITDSRMERMLRHFNSKPDKIFEKNIRVFSLPTNADLSIKETQSIIRGFIFPRWGICTQHKGYTILMQFSEPSHNNIILDCPKCRAQNLVPIRGVPIRFVQACTRGHLQDLYWPKLVHKGSTCTNKIFEWRDIGGDNFIISCTKCNMKIDYLGKDGLKLKSMNGHLDCSAQFPEVNPNFDQKYYCEKDKNDKGVPVSLARLVLRNSTGLHSAKNLTSVQIPKISGLLYKELVPHVTVLRTILHYNPKLNKSKLVSELKQLDVFTSDTLNEIEQTSEDELIPLVKDMVNESKQNIQNMGDQKSLSESESNDEELTSLLEAAKTGYPPSATIGKKHAYVNIEDRILIESKEFGVKFRITPIKELHVIKTQVGYTREVGGTGSVEDLANSRIGELVTKSNYYDDEDETTRWYLGDENFGEGIFIDIVESDIDGAGGLNPIDRSSSTDIDTWNTINKKLDEYLENFSKIDMLKKDELQQEITKSNSRFVWWHTLCHKLLLNLTVDSGFSIVSFGERVYCKKNKRTGKYQSGILIYTSATGSDGTLGGLVSLAKKEFMTELFKKTANGILSCSNDPVCSERKIAEDKKEGSCCHACELLSETTCNYQNRNLDRNLVKDTMP